MTDRITVFFDARVLEHDTGRGFFEAAASPYLPLVESHPENRARLENMLGVLETGPLAASLDWQRAAPAEVDELAKFHQPAYIEELASIPADETRWYSGTTVFGPGSYEICRAAAGQAIGAARHVFDGSGKIAYALVRPPGHHAQPAMADGYCFFNNVGVAIEALRARGLKSAAVIDWDVHHGNGTQEAFYRDPDILTISLHMDHGAWGATHPQTGGADEAGAGAGLGKNLNIPLPFGSGDRVYSRIFDRLVAPAVREHRPEILFVAAGQDANQFDPNGRQLLTMAGFHALGERARSLAEECCEGRLVLVQEGGYEISYAAYCLHATLEGVLRREAELADPLAYMRDSDDGLDDFIDRLERRRAAAMTSRNGQVGK